MAYDLRKCTSKEEWDSFVGQSPQANVFCQSFFLDALGVDYDLWLLMAEGGALAAGAVLLKDRTGAVLNAPHPLSMYHGLLMGSVFKSMPIHRRSKETLEVTAAFLAQLESRHERLSFCQHPGFDDLRGFSWFHYHEQERGMFRIDLRYTGLIDLTAHPDFEGYLSSIRPGRRNEYRKAVKNGLTAEASDDVDLLSRLYQLTFERQGLAKDAVEFSLLKSIASKAISNGSGELLVARLPGGEAVSATLFLSNANTGYYLVGANHPEHRHSNSGIFAFVESLRRGHSRGVERIDVCGINSPRRGDFKTSFNARPTPYFVMNWS